MTLKDAIKTVRNAREVWVWVNVTGEEGEFFTVSKAEAIKTLKRLVESCPACNGHLKIRCPEDSKVCIIG